MKINETDIKALNKEEVKSLISFLMKNSFFTNQMFPYVTFQFLFIFGLVGSSIYFLSKKYNWMVIVENKDTGKKIQ